MEEQKEGIRMKVKCPYCGYEMPIMYDTDAMCKGIFIVCKGRNCKRAFQVVIEEGVQVVPL